jgi:hypothetical protein
MLLVKSNIFGRILNTKNTRKLNFIYLFICSSMFKISNHKLTTFSLSFCLTLDTYCVFFKIIIEFPIKHSGDPRSDPPDLRP